MNEESEDLLETTVESLSEEIPMEEIPIHAIHPSENTSEKQSTPNETMPFTTTRSGRIVKPKQMFEASSATLQLYDILNISMSEAMKTQPESATESIIKELEQMIEKEVWTPIHPSKTKEKNIIPSKMFLKEKIEGALTFLKSRLVAGGHRQIRTIEDVVSSPTADMTTIFIIALLAAMLRKKVCTLDITGAYLNAKMNKDVYMRLNRQLTAILVKRHPEYLPFVCKDGTLVVKLERALYGCIESARLWYEDLSIFLIEDLKNLIMMTACL